MQVSVELIKTVIYWALVFKGVVIISNMIGWFIAEIIDDLFEKLHHKLYYDKKGKRR